MSLLLTCKSLHCRAIVSTSNDDNDELLAFTPASRMKCQLLFNLVMIFTSPQSHFTVFHFSPFARPSPPQLSTILIPSTDRKNQIMKTKFSLFAQLTCSSGCYVVIEIERKLAHVHRFFCFLRKQKLNKFMRLPELLPQI